MLIGQLGWTEDEYEDGEKKHDDDIDLDEERAILAKPDGFLIIWIKRDKNLPKSFDNVFSRVCTKFYQTMAKAQANYTISEVGVVINSALKKKYDDKKTELMGKGCSQEEWGFHGTSEDAIGKICVGGFLHPDDIAKLNQSASVGKKVKKKKPIIDVLDDGFEKFFLNFF
jgi:hypothetical protein